MKSKFCRSKYFSFGLIVFLMVFISACSSTETAHAPVVRYAYVTNLGSDNVSVIRTSDNTVTATVNVGSSPSLVAIK